MAIDLLSNIIILCGLAGVAAIILYIVSEKFKIQTSTTEKEIYDILPHVNCGGCGKAGCQDFATACAKASEKEFSGLRCPVGGDKLMVQIAKIKGMLALTKQKTCAVLLCNGTCQNAPEKMIYTGLKSCRAASTIMAGSSGCPDGCLRFGDCVKGCRFGALSINPQTGIPNIDYKKCTSCGECVKRCPRGLFEIRPIDQGQQVYVACRNRQKGAVARQNCAVACIACGKCSKINSEITVENNLAYIPSTVSAAEYGESLAKECPVKAIHYVHHTKEKSHEK